MTESDWSFFRAEWDRYAEATELSKNEASAVPHLWASCTDSLRKALHNEGAAAVTSPSVLLGRIKSLAVRRWNNLVNVLGLQKMGQERDEGVNSYLARLNRQADL